MINKLSYDLVRKLNHGSWSVGDSVAETFLSLPKEIRGVTDEAGVYKRRDAAIV
jgi:hypothetical protein